MKGPKSKLTLRKRLSAIWHGPEALYAEVQRLEAQLHDQRDDIKYDIQEDIKADYNSLDDRVEDLEKEVGQSIEEMGGRIEDFESELIKIDSRIEDLEGKEWDQSDIDVPRLFDRLQSELEKRRRQLDRAGALVGEGTDVPH